MKVTEIKLTTLEDLREFVAICTCYEEDIDVISGRYTIDGKSIMGLMSINLQQNIKVLINTSDVKVQDRFFSEIQKFQKK